MPNLNDLMYAYLQDCFDEFPALSAAKISITRVYNDYKVKTADCNEVVEILIDRDDLLAWVWSKTTAPAKQVKTPPPANQPAIIREDFMAAAEGLLGTRKFSQMRAQDATADRICKEVAIDHFIGALASYPSADSDLRVIQDVATRLWAGDGITGFAVTK